MARVKRGTTKLKRRKNILKMVKGYRFARSKKERAAKEAIFHAGKYAFAHRRDKKNDFRKLWNVRINGALDAGNFEQKNGKPLSYSRLIDALNKKKVLVNRKMLSELAAKSPESFARLVKQVS
jgi:large subunit ribosomal protein L20